MTKNEEIKARLAALKAKATGATNAVTKAEESTSKELVVSQESSTVVVAPPVQKVSRVTHDPDSPYAPFKMKLAELEDHLDNEVPGFAFLLREIHQTMRADPNVVTIMSEDEIGLVVAGLSKHMDVTITPAKGNSGRSKGGRTQPFNAADL